MKVFFSTIILFMLLSMQSSHAQTVHRESGLYWYAEEDGPAVEFDLLWKTFTVGNPYINAQIDENSFVVTGYTYRGENYSGYDLDFYGVTFPIKTGGYATVSGTADLDQNAGCGGELQDLHARNVDPATQTSYFIPFEDETKKCLDEKRKEGNNWEIWTKFRYIEVEHAYADVSMRIEAAIRKKIQDDKLSKRRDELWDIYESVCRENYTDIDRALKASGKLNTIFSEKNILADWQQKSLQDCSARLKKKIEELQSEGEESDDEYSIQNLYNQAINRARNAEANGDYYRAADEYKTAYALDSQYWLQGKIKEMEQRAQTQAVATGATVFVTGMNEVFGDLPTGRLNGTYVFSINYDNLNSGGTDGLGGMKGSGPGGFFTLDQTFWFNKYKKLGFQLGAIGSYSEFWDKYEGNNSFTDGYSSQPYVLDLGIFAGFNFFGKFELDYYFRGLAIKGEYSAEDPNFSQGRMDRPIGGKLHYDGGVRTAVYLYSNKEFFIRGSAWYIDALEDSPVKFLDNSNNDNKQTVSYGYRIEIAKRPWSLVLYSRHDAYYTTDALNIGFDSWGIGVGFGLGTSK